MNLLPAVWTSSEVSSVKTVPILPTLDNPSIREKHIKTSPKLAVERHELQSLLANFPETVQSYGSITVLGSNVFADVPQSVRIGCGLSFEDVIGIGVLSEVRSHKGLPNPENKLPNFWERKRARRFVKAARKINDYITNTNSLIQIENGRVVVVYDEVAAELPPDDNEPRWNTLHKLFNAEKQLGGPIIEKTIEDIVFDAVEYTVTMLKGSNLDECSARKLWGDFGLGRSLAELSKAQKLHTWWLQHQTQIENGYLPQTDYDRALLGKAMRSHAFVGLAGMGVVDAFVQLEDATLSQQLRAVDNGWVPKPQTALDWLRSDR